MKNQSLKCRKNGYLETSILVQVNKQCLNSQRNLEGVKQWIPVLNMNPNIAFEVYYFSPGLLQVDGSSLLDPSGLVGNVSPKLNTSAKVGHTQ
jgi:hypothetical protein